MPRLGELFNVRLMSEPLNWAILFVVATVWLLAFHVVMQGFTAMQGGDKQASVAGGPGQIAVTSAGVEFATGSTIAGGLDASQVAINLSAWGFDGVSDGTWTDSTEGKYAWDDYTNG
jgi:hypothetical protein